jgi:predicted phage tail protein
MNNLCGFILCAIALPVVAGPVVEIKGGRYHLSVGGEIQEDYHNQNYKAIKAAVNLSLSCDCPVSIIQPTLVVTVKYRSDDSALITWTAPTQRVNGESLSEADIQGYELTIELDEVKAVVNVGNVTTYTAKGLVPGLYTFTVKAVDKSGFKSDPSKSAYKVIAENSYKKGVK